MLRYVRGTVSFQHCYLFKSNSKRAGIIPSHHSTSLPSLPPPSLPLPSPLTFHTGPHSPHVWCWSDASVVLALSPHVHCRLQRGVVSSWSGGHAP